MSIVTGRLCLNNPANCQFGASFLRTLGLSLFFMLVIPTVTHADPDGPTIHLFPTTVVEDLRLTSSVAKEMETGVQEVIGRLDQQQQLYEESKCQGAEDDPGCQRLAQQIGSTYLEMLGIMEERLPDMEHTVNNTRLSLEKRLRSELGNKMTSWTLQETRQSLHRVCVADPACDSASALSSITSLYRLPVHKTTSRSRSLHRIFIWTWRKPAILSRERGRRSHARRSWNN